MAKAVLRGNFIALSVNIRKDEKSQGFHLENPGKGEQNKVKASRRRRSIIKIKAGVNKTEWQENNRENQCKFKS